MYHRMCLSIWLLLAVLVPSSSGAMETLTIGITQFPSTLHPNIDSMAAKSYVLSMTRRPFTEYDEKWKPRCFLCTRLPTFDNGLAREEPAPDGGRGVAVTYQIRPGARWGDGTPVTTEDVLFTWEVGRHPKSGVGNAELYRRIWRIEVLDDRTFRIFDRKLTFQYNTINDFRILPAHLEKEIFEADPATYRNRTLYDTDPTNPGLYFGPYRITELVSGSHIVLKRNPTWYGRKPFFDRIVVRTIENTAALEAHLLSGEIDMVDGGLGMSLDQALAFEKRHGDRFRVHYQPGLVYEHIDLMLDNPLLADRRIRQGLLYALDRETLVEQLFGGRQPVADSSVHPLDWVHDPSTPHYAFDPKRAAELFEQAGFRRGTDGIRVDAAGHRLRFELMTTAGNRTRELVEQVLQGMWRQAGVEISIRNQPARVFFGETVARRRFPGMAMFAWISSPENPPRSTLHSEEIPSEQNGWSGQNYAGYRNPEMDALIDAIEVELDPRKRKELWSRLQHLYARDLPALPLYFRSNPHIWPRWLEGVVTTGHQAPTTLWVEYWHRRSG